MRILHTSDWHLGRTLHGRKRYDEFQALLDWMIDTLDKQSVELLIISGDIFDTAAPSNQAQELYYDFLFRASKTNCRHIAVLGGNHDSPTFLEAPKQLLKVFHVHVVGSAPRNIEDEVLVLFHQGDPEAIVCAVPYLRDRDIRTVGPGETPEVKNRKLAQGTAEHYRLIGEQVESLKEKYGNIPVIGSGHLFCSGGRTREGDGVRELYVGSLAHVPVDIFPTVFDYTALGHLHLPQKAGGKDTVRYSGSPVPMNCSESSQKRIVIADVNSGSVEIEEIPVPVFQPMAAVKGDIPDIIDQMSRLAHSGESVWIEVEYTGSDVTPNLRELIDQAAENTQLDILRITNRQLSSRVLSSSGAEFSLDDLGVHQVFQRCLEAYEIPEDDQKELKGLYLETLKHIEEEQHEDT